MAADADRSKAILVNLSPETHRQLKELAVRERRAMSHQAGIAIEEHLSREATKEGAKS